MSNLTPQQQAVKNFVRNGKGNAIVEARAGTGKTHTLLECMPDMRGEVAYSSYNNANVKEAKAKVAARGLRHVHCATFHSFGLNAWRQANKNVKVEGTGRDGAGYRKFDRIAEELAFPKHLLSFISKAMDLAKQRAFGILCPLNDPQAWLDLVQHFDLESEITEETIKSFGGGDKGFLVKMGLRGACKGLKKSYDLGHEVIDFSDMLWLPLIGNARFRQFDWVLVDEAQDTNQARRCIARAMLRPGGRALFVGDAKQSIYGFTGADNDSLDQIRRDFSATTLPLTVTFRCPKKVVEEAKVFVPDYEAAPEAPEGEVRAVDEAEFWTEATTLGADDAIICRKTKPLVQCCFNLIRRGIRAYVEGKDIGRGLLSLIARWRDVPTLPVLLEKLEEHREEETQKLMAAGKEMQADALNDKIDTIAVIAQTLPPTAEIADLHAKIEDLFTDTKEGEAPKGVRLLTAHRSKGLEFRRVFLWGRAAYMPSPYARQDWCIQQERNLEYVALTRAMNTLVDVFVVPD